MNIYKVEFITEEGKHWDRTILCVVAESYAKAEGIAASYPSTYKDKIKSIEVIGETTALQNVFKLLK